MADGARRLASTMVAIASWSLAPGDAAALQEARAATRHRGPIWSVEIGALRATPFVEDGNGVTVRTAIGPYVGGQVAMRRGKAVAVMAGIRASVAAIRVESGDREWGAGRAQRYDLHLGVETATVRSVRLTASAVGGLVTGPGDVIPFRRDGEPLLVWGGALDGSHPLIRQWGIDLHIGADVARVASQRRENPALAGGWMARVRLGVLHALP